MKTLERGFKAWSERTSLAVRKELELGVDEALCPFQLAGHLDIKVLRPEEVRGITDDVLKALLHDDPWGWSATSFSADDRSTIIFNPRHSAGRRSSDIAHELAHELLGHQPATMIVSLELNNFCMRSFNQKQEDEANCLGWTLLLPREGLLRAKLKKRSTSEIARQFGVSEPLVNFRVRMTGIGKQVRN